MRNHARYLPFHQMQRPFHGSNILANEIQIYFRLDYMSNSIRCFHHNIAHAPEITTNQNI